MHLVFYLLCFWHAKDIFTLNEYGGWAGIIRFILAWGSSSIFLREQVNLQFLQVILGIKYSFRNLNAL
jgi:succinate-acetate transporter protein